MNDPVWLCKYNHGVDCGKAIPNCYTCGWNPFNESLRCYRIIKVLGVKKYVDRCRDINAMFLGNNIQGRRETR